MPITALDVVGGVSSVLKSRKKKRKERRKRRREKARAKAEARNEFNAGFNPGLESTGEAMNLNVPGSSRDGETSTGNGNSNMLMYIVGGFLIYKFLLKK